MTELSFTSKDSLEPAYFGNERRALGDKLFLAPPPIDGEWLPKSAVYALVDLMAVIFGLPKGLFKDCAKQIQSGMQIIQEVDLKHSAIWMAGVYLMILMQFLENKVAVEPTRSEFVEAQEASESIIEMLRGQYAHSVGCYSEAAFHYVEAAKLTVSKPMQAMCHAYAAEIVKVDYLGLLMEFLGPIIEILKCIGPRFCKYIEYHRKLEEYKKNLKRILDELQGQKDGMELRLKAECGFGKLTKPEVNNWLINVRKIIDEAKNIEDTFKKVKCFSRVLGAELVDKKIQEAKEYYEKGTSLSSFNSLVIDAPPPVGITLPTTRLAGETTAKKNMEEIWGHLMEGLVDERDNLQVTEERAHIIIKSLVSNCLLLESIDYKGRSCVKLHDIVRDMTIRYITSKSPLFMVKAGLKLDELPSEREWKENLDKVSLMKNRVREIPSSLSPNCRILSTLFLQDNPLESIPESFFTHMHGLKILNLSETEIEILPNSISELTNLTALLLQKCGRLKRVPSLARLRALVKLELGYTSINEVPAGMEMLANLTSLDLLCSELHMIPAGIFSKLCRLQKLRVNWGLETLKVAVEEAATLKKLDRLLAQVHNLQDFNCYAKSLNSQGGPNEYRLFFIPLEINIGFHYQDQLEWNKLCDWTLPYELNKEVILRGVNICGREEEDIIFLPKEVEKLLIRDCHDVRNLSSIPTFNTLEKLETLEVQHLSNLSGILLNVSSESSPVGQYSHLKVVGIYGCHKVMKLISSKLMSELKNLEQIDVQNCGEMEELIAVDDDDDNEERSPKEFLHPKLRKLTLYHMRELKSICSCNGLVMVCDSLQVINLWDCPKLKKILSSSSKLQLGVLKNLKVIDVYTCGEMEEIIAIDDVDCKKELMISLPKLRKLTLVGMPELKSIINVCGSTNGVLMVCDSLQEIVILNCPQLKRFPIYLPIDEKGEPSPPPALNKIEVYRGWWEALEWDNPNAQTLLLPFCKF
ncbi:hypothetical protein LWI29_028403 [Acer saccharum]|uniref:Uncharacterized protein n=1 Tax=Acer saccharum TaxID=4024 RepID=A0AA39V9I2_ACESA|nr:hypothetical protein LWI29_028403 [Acer saccharum]